MAPIWHKPMPIHSRKNQALRDIIRIFNTVPTYKTIIGGLRVLKKTFIKFLTISETKVRRLTLQPYPCIHSWDVATYPWENEWDLEVFVPKSALKLILHDLTILRKKVSFFRTGVKKVFLFWKSHFRPHMRFFANIGFWVLQARMQLCILRDFKKKTKFFKNGWKTVWNLLVWWKILLKKWCYPLPLFDVFPFFC